MKKLTLCLAAALLVAFSSQQALSQQKQEIAAECTTKGTESNGSRNSCDSAVTKITAPPNHVFAEKTLTGGETSGAGSEHECRIAWHDYVEVIPNSGITQPRTVTLQAHARSPKHKHGARGWAKCKYQVDISKYN